MYSVGNVLSKIQFSHYNDLEISENRLFDLERIEILKKKKLKPSFSVFS